MANSLPIYVPQDAIDAIKRRRTARGIGDLTGDCAVTIDLYPLEQQGFVRYEPAVPRCKTCPNFNDDPPLLLPHCGLLEEAPADGSGYCSEHPEAKR